MPSTPPRPPSSKEPLVILLADDDEDDRRLSMDALKKSQLCNTLHCVEDGEELMEYLKHQGRYSDPALAPRPGLILLDLNMPRKDGREAQAEEDIYSTYDLGVNSFITNPVTFEGLVKVMNTLGHDQLEIVKLPGTSQSHPGQ